MLDSQVGMFIYIYMALVAIFIALVVNLYASSKKKSKQRSL